MKKNFHRHYASLYVRALQKKPQLIGLEKHMRHRKNRIDHIALPNPSLCIRNGCQFGINSDGCGRRSKVCDIQYYGTQQKEPHQFSDTLRGKHRAFFFTTISVCNFNLQPCIFSTILMILHTVPSLATGLCNGFWLASQVGLKIVTVFFLCRNEQT